MAEAPAITMAAAALAVPDAPLVRAGVRLELAPPALRLSLRTRDPELLSRTTGLVLPSRIGEFSDGVARLGPDEWLAILSSEQLASNPVLLNPPPLGEVAARRADGGGGLKDTGFAESGSPSAPSVSLREPPPPAGEDLRRAALAAILSGGAGLPLSIVDVSSRSCGMLVSGPDAATVIGAGCPLDLDRIAPGRATRTLFETVEIILIRNSELEFHIEVWRSFAPWLFAALSAASPA